MKIILNFTVERDMFRHFLYIITEMSVFFSQYPPPSFLELDCELQFWNDLRMSK